MMLAAREMYGRGPGMVCVAIMVMAPIDADAAHVMVMRRLRRARRRLVADHLRAIFAEAAIHAGLAVDGFADAVGKAIEHERMIVEVGRFQDLHLGMRGAD